MSNITTRLAEEIKRRRTFAIISHPDAGKTTLTEKLLLYGGAIHQAGSVKARKAARHATSDWMEIEKQRGISVTSTVLQFDYEGFRVNILDTPGHEDFSEDTYRTLMAVDSAVMLIDVAKGIEAQTKKLFKVCRQRGIPIFTFVNKLDRHGKNPFELMEEIEKVLGIRAYPMNWPIGINGEYKGVYNRQQAQIELFDTKGGHGQWVLPAVKGSVDDPAFTEIIGDDSHRQLCEDIELLDMAGDSFNMDLVAKGELTPMFFGSAMTNFGVRPFLEEFLKLAPLPAPRLSSDGIVEPEDERFSAFVFKIQANMNPAHRDRIAFIRICSGIFEKGMSVTHERLGKSIKLSQPQQFLAQERVVVEEAYPGDIIGLFDPGQFTIGDSLYSGNQPIVFEDFPVFPPEQFARVQAKDTMRRKQFVKGLEQLTQEGAVQFFRQPEGTHDTYIIGAVGSLQFDVFQYRLKQEYNVELSMQLLPYELVRWLDIPGAEVKKYKGLDRAMRVEDRNGRTALLFPNEWSLRWAMDNNENLEFLMTPPK